MKKTFATLIVLLFLSSLGYYALRPSSPLQNGLACTHSPQVRLGVSLEPLSVLAMVAESEGFFTKACLDTQVEKFPSGKRALVNGLFGGRSDVVFVAEAPIVFNSFKRDDFAIIASIGVSGNGPRVIARTDRGIIHPKDLIGKHLATQKASAVHFFLHLFMLKQGISTSDASLSFMKAEQLPLALAKGDIDAFSMREPFISQASKLLPGKTVVFTEPGLYQKFFNVVALKSFIKEHPEEIKQVVRGLVEAEKYVQSHPKEGMEILSKWLGVTVDETLSQQLHMEFRVTLSQQLLVALSDEARWAIKAGFTPVKVVPNYLEFLYSEAMDVVHPEAVSLIR